MAILNNGQYFYDIISEIVAKKSGILLSKIDINRIATNEEDDFLLEITNSDPFKGYRVYPDEIEQIISSLRKRIGNLPDDEDATGKLVSIVKYYSQDRRELYELTVALKHIILRISFEGMIDEKMYNKNRLLLRVGITYERFLEIYKIYLNYDILLEKESPITNEWDGIIPLSELFSSEIVPSESEKYFDQRFINYLAENTEDLNQIHWRNFERLITEFFNDNGYHVQLGPGQNDGGIDVRVWSDKESNNGPPLILIQCKRYKKEKISLETIKAFYADILYEDAKIGLIATTTNLTAGGKKVIQSRGYNIDQLESEDISNMVKGMWRNPLK